MAQGGTIVKSEPTGSDGKEKGIQQNPLQTDDYGASNTLSEMLLEMKKIRRLLEIFTGTEISDTDV